MQCRVFSQMLKHYRGWGDFGSRLVTMGQNSTTHGSFVLSPAFMQLKMMEKVPCN